MKINKVFRSNYKILFLIVLIAIIILEKYFYNYFLNSHHSWVSLHTLSIVKNTNFKTGLVGYACEFINNKNQVFFDYFNRYSFIFPLISKLILNPFEKNISLYLFFSRQFMNIIYFFTLINLFQIGKNLGFKKNVSFAATLITGSSAYWLYYKNMFHFDQPALLGFCILILSTIKILKNKSPISEKYITNSKNKEIIYLIIISLVTLIGRSIFSTFSLFTLLLLSFFQQDIKIKRCQTILLKAFLLNIIIQALTLNYNILVETFINNTSYFDSGIFKSIINRLNINNKIFADANEDVIKILPNYIYLLRLFISLFFFLPPATIIIGLFNFLLKKNIAKSENQNLINLSLNSLKENRLFNFIILVNIFSFILWAIFFKNLINFHDYAVIYIIPTFFFLNLYLIQNLEINYKKSKLSKIDNEKIFKPTYLFITFLIFYYIIAVDTFSNHNPSKLNQKQIQNVDIFFKEINEYNAYIKKHNLQNHSIQRNINWIPSSPYAQCFLLNNKFTYNEEVDLKKLKIPETKGLEFKNRLTIKREVLKIFTQK